MTHNNIVPNTPNWRLEVGENAAATFAASTSPFGRSNKVGRSPPPATLTTETSKVFNEENAIPITNNMVHHNTTVIGMSNSTTIQYEQLASLCKQQQQLINEMRSEIDNLKHHISMNKIINPSNLLIQQSTSSLLTSNILEEKVIEYATDEEELAKEFPKLNEEQPRKRRRTKTKSPPKNITNSSAKPAVNNLNNAEQKQPKISLPPPINVSNVINFDLFRKKILSVVKQSVLFKALSNSDIKITVIDTEDYRNIKKLLQETRSEEITQELKMQEKDPSIKVKKIEYHTYQLKEERTFRFVIRGLPCTIHHDEIKADLVKLKHDVANISNISKMIKVNGRKQRKEFPLFSIDLIQNENNKDVFNIKNLAHCKVSIEAPNKSRAIPQCTNCQQLGHTKSFCNRESRCVKCGQDHHYKECKQQPGTVPTCALCQERGHTANYKGCPAYQAKLKSQNQKQNSITVVQRLQAKPTIPQTTIQPHTSGLSYAQVTKNPIDNQNKREDQTSTNNNELNNNQIISMLSQIQQTLSQLTERVEKLETKVKPLEKQAQKNNG